MARPGLLGESLSASEDLAGLLGASFLAGPSRAALPGSPGAWELQTLRPRPGASALCIGIGAARAAAAEEKAEGEVSTPRGCLEGVGLDYSVGGESLRGYLAELLPSNVCVQGSLEELRTMRWPLGRAVCAELRSPPRSGDAPAESLFAGGLSAAGGVLSATLLGASSSVSDIGGVADDPVAPPARSILGGDVLGLVALSPRLSLESASPRGTDCAMGSPTQYLEEALGDAGRASERSSPSALRRLSGSRGGTLETGRDTPCETSPCASTVLFEVGGKFYDAYGREVAVSSHHQELDASPDRRAASETPEFTASAASSWARPSLASASSSQAWERGAEAQHFSWAEGCRAGGAPLLETVSAEPSQASSRSAYPSAVTTPAAVSAAPPLAFTQESKVGSDIASSDQILSQRQRGGIEVLVDYNGHPASLGISREPEGSGVSAVVDEDMFLGRCRRGGVEVLVEPPVVLSDDRRLRAPLRAHSAPRQRPSEAIALSCHVGSKVARPGHAERPLLVPRDGSDAHASRDDSDGRDACEAPGGAAAGRPPVAGAARPRLRGQLAAQPASSGPPRGRPRSASVRGASPGARATGRVQSNRKLIRNAVEWYLLKGDANRVQRDQVLYAFDGDLAGMERFVILFRSIHTGRHDLRALYGYKDGLWVRALQLLASPPLLEERMVAQCLRYDSGVKEFKEVPSVQELLNVVDAVFLHQKYLQKPRES